MRMTTTTCDRCRKLLHLGVGRPEPVPGRLRGRLDDRPVDLCRDCADAFRAWLIGGTAPTVAGVEGRRP
ncbi:hypothetical protein [Paludisphaera sp.]|uniref:hypothetical protein n=1 Tax=Paludisphaera sp. TaxID=2017432 RepID=UPI00301E2152